MKAAILLYIVIHLTSCIAVDRSNHPRYRLYVGKKAVTTQPLKILRTENTAYARIRRNVLTDYDWPEHTRPQLVKEVKAGTVFRITKVVEKYGFESGYAMLMFGELENPRIIFEYEISYPIGGDRDHFPKTPWKLIK